MKISEHIRVDRDSPTPLEVQLTEQLRWLIVRGQIEPGEKLPPVRQLADDLGINMHTARAAYRRLVAAGLVESRPGVGTTVLEYNVDRILASVADVPSFTVGVVVPSLEAFYTPMLDAIEDALQDEPTMLVVCNTRKDPAKAAWYLDQLIVRGVDGIILVSQDGHGALDIPTTRSDLFPPTVTVDWPTASDPVVLFDTKDGGHQAAAHLIEHGHERIGIITPPIEANVAEVHAGIVRALTNASLTLLPELVTQVADWTIQSGVEGASQLLALDPPPTAILALADPLAVGVIQTATAHDLDIPGDVALVSFGDVTIARYLDPPLTTVHLASAEAGTAATKMLCRLIASQSLDSPRVTLPTQLITRRSCGCLPQVASSHEPDSYRA